MTITDFAGNQVMIWHQGQRYPVHAIVPAWTPNSILGLAAWFDSTQDTFADGQSVDVYTEHSSAARVFNAAFAGSAPIFRAGAGRPYLELFTAGGGTGGFVSAVPWDAGTAGLTFVFVGQITGGSYPMMLVWGPEADGVEMRHDGSAQQIVLMYTSYGIYYSNAVPSAGYVDHLFMLRVDVPQHRSEAWTNAAKTVGAAPAAMPAARTLYVGKRESGYPFVGRMYEALVFAGPISDPDWSRLTDYLRAKWGLA
jgi:hypothetical protein